MTKCRHARPETPVFAPSTDTYGTKLRSAGSMSPALVCDIARQPLILPVLKSPLSPHYPYIPSLCLYLYYFLL